MKRLKMAVIVALVVLLNPSHACANGMWALGALGHAASAGVVGCVVVACAICLPQSKSGLVCCLVLGGVVGAVASPLYGATTATPLWLMAGAILVGCLVAGGANKLPRPTWGLLFWPVLGGLIAETSVALWYLPKGNILGVVLVAGIATAFLGVSLGVVALLVTTVVRKSKEKSNSGDSSSETVRSKT